MPINHQGFWLLGASAVKVSTQWFRTSLRWYKSSDWENFTIFTLARVKRARNCLHISIAFLLHFDDCGIPLSWSLNANVLKLQKIAYSVVFKIPSKECPFRIILHFSERVKKSKLHGKRTILTLENNEKQNASKKNSHVNLNKISRLFFSPSKHLNIFTSRSNIRKTCIDFKGTTKKELLFIILA